MKNMHTKDFNFNKKTVQQTGFSLVELLIAMVISLTIIFACTSLYSSLKSSVRVAQDLAKAQESLRGSFYLMSRSIHQANSITISGAQLTINYTEPPTGGVIYSCLGNSMTSGSAETYSSNGSGLYCDDGTGPQLIALDIEGLQFAAVNVDGVKITMEIAGMPSSYVGGLTFTLALRQKVLLGLAE
jgi:prepilin-type N-terminal cleavage/methylation domain-containing protein